MFGTSTFDGSDERRLRRVRIHRSLRRLEHYSSQRLSFTPEGECVLRGFDDETGRFVFGDGSSSTLTGTTGTASPVDGEADAEGGIRRGRGRWCGLGRGRGRGLGRGVGTLSTVRLDEAGAPPKEEPAEGGGGGGGGGGGDADGDAAGGSAPPSDGGGAAEKSGGPRPSPALLLPLSVMAAAAASALAAALYLWGRSAAASSLRARRRPPAGAVSSAGEGAAAAAAAGPPPDPLRGALRGALFDVVVGSDVTSRVDLTLPGTAPSLALEWLTAEDGWLPLPPPDDGSEEGATARWERSALERYAMAALFFSASAPVGGGGGRWMSPTESVCDWAGVTCAYADSRPGRRDDLFAHSSARVEVVSALDLDGAGWGRGGRIPEEVSALRDLRVLDLGNNGLVGTLPDSLGDLRRLEVLRLRGNSLTGSVPDSVCSLTGRNGPPTVGVGVGVGAGAAARPRTAGAAPAAAPLREFSADCGPDDEPGIRCGCCTSC